MSTTILKRAALVLALTVSAPFAATAQQPQTPAFSPRETFASLTLPDPVNAYRSSDGSPGPHYWQNRADYNLHAKIDTDTHILTGNEVITYTNNSPDTLTSLWLHLEQNTYRPDARSKAFASSGLSRRFAGGFTEGYSLDSVEVQPAAAKAATKATTVVSDTRLQIQLPATLALHHGQQLRILIHYHYTVPGRFGGRTSWDNAQQGPIYDIAQWYPRMCVYDDLRGWDTQPYLANEFYLEYGHFDYTVTVPSNFLVAGSGQLMNPAEVLTAAEQSRLAKARTSDKTVMIRTAEEAAAASSPHPTTTKTWHFAMDNTRDVVFSASPVFLWDAARINIPANPDVPTQHARTALAQSVYPVESAGDAAWGRSTEYLKDSVEHFSARWYPYPWPNAINVAGFSSGMEYPGVLFDGINDKGAALFWVTAHEIGHTWFPMVVGFNERRNAWMDEGFNTFIDIFESDEFAHGIYGPKRDGEYAPDKTLSNTPADQIVKVLTDPAAPAIMTRADAIGERYRHPVTYFKSAFGLTLLRDDILGPERFDFAFRKFIRDWAFKHPSPSDFFRAMASNGGEDLDYFWRGWYFNNWTLDLAVTSAKHTDNDPSKPLEVTVENRGQLVVPALLRVELKNGQHTDLHIPAETWLQVGAHTFTITTPSLATSVTIDPNQSIPDVDRSNNIMAVKP
ncbi:MAG: M1 family metallopeptidase [Acidobacteriota bacterium]